MKQVDRVLVLDDHAVVRSGIKSAFVSEFGWSVIEAASISEAIAAVSSKHPHLVIVDINLPDGSGAEFIQWFRKIDQETPIVVLSFNESGEIQRTIASAGANGFVSKSAPLSELMTAIRAVISSKQTFITFGIPAVLSREKKLSQLSVREITVISQLAIGGSIQDISRRMHISPSTLKTHISNIYRKLEVGDRTQALNKAREIGVI